MTRRVPLWYGKEFPLFEAIEESHPRLQIQRIPGGYDIICDIVISRESWSSQRKWLPQVTDKLYPVRVYWVQYMYEAIFQDNNNIIVEMFSW
jgi:hypothetical protein